MNIYETIWIHVNKLKAEINEGEGTGLPYRINYVENE